MNTKEFLQARWEVTLLSARFSPPNGGIEVFEDLYQRYTEPHRHYHTAEHLEYCFNALDQNFFMVPGRTQVELALWFHDAVYDTTAKDNEEQSAELAKKACVALGATTIFAYTVADLILTTKHTSEPSGAGAKILLDADTAILGADRKEYLKYETNIRQEYSWVPEPIFRQKRIEVLQSFLNRPHIFLTDEFRNSHETQAQTNLRGAIAGLL